MHKKKILIFLIGTLFLFNSCNTFKKADARTTPTSGLERAKINVKEGRSVSLGGLAKGRGGTNYEFSTSNPMWRASLDTLDFLPLSVVDYSGGLLITDWYNNNKNSNESLKITVRFLSNEIRSDSLKITVHQKQCLADLNCTINILNSKIKEELASTILKTAALIEKDN
jgi:hypothetical protein